MKKAITPILLILCLIFGTSCSPNTKNESYEDKLLGIWATYSNGKTLMYTFEYEDGEYIGSCWANDELYIFDEFSASSRVITVRQKGGNTMKMNYEFEDEYLYIDGIELEKFEP